MFKEDNPASEPMPTNPIHVGAAALVDHERVENNGHPKLGRKQRVVRAAGSRSEVRPVRIGRIPQAASLIVQSQSPPPVGHPAQEMDPTSVSSTAEPAAIGDVLAGGESRRAVNPEMMKAIADLHAKFDAMKESFETLEAHISVGLAKSIAEIVRGEVSSLEQQIVARYRYRTRYWLALWGVLALVSMIVIDHFHPFFDRSAALVGY